MMILKAALRILGAALILWWVGLPLLERASIYYPNVPGRRLEMTPAQIGLEFEEVSFDAPDGVRLAGWWIPAKEPRATVIFFHGNAGNISHRLFQAELLHRLNLHLFLFDYRGYGESQGRPGERGLYKDALAARRHVAGRPEVDAGRLVYYGESLGAAVAMEQAMQAPPRLLVAESAFASVPAMARRLYPWLPVRNLLRSRYDNLSKVGKIRCPMLFIHSREDEIVPFAQAEQLVERSGAGLKRLLPLSGGHNEMFMIHRDRIAAEIDRFLKENGL